jgi:hypothetical protein
MNRANIKRTKETPESSIKKPMTTFEGSEHSANTCTGIHRYTKNNKALNLFIHLRIP